MLVQDGKLRFLQQDRALIEDQPISQGSLARLKSVYAYFSPGQIKHLLHPVDVKMAWVSTLKACIQGMGIASDVQIAGPSKFKIPGIPDNTLGAGHVPNWTSMVMTKPINNLTPAEQFKALRAQIPVIEMAECATEELIELPTRPTG